MPSDDIGSGPQRGADTDLLFVYGLLRRDAGGPMSRTLARQAQRLGRGFFQGRIYLVRHYPGAVVSTSPRDRVHGEVYRLTDPQRTLALLDEYEGCAANGADCEYERRRIPATLASGERVHAWVYLYSKPTRGLERIRSGNFSRRTS